MWSGVSFGLRMHAVVRAHQTQRRPGNEPEFPDSAERSAELNSTLLKTPVELRAAHVLCRFRVEAGLAWLLLYRSSRLHAPAGMQSPLVMARVFQARLVLARAAGTDVKGGRLAPSIEGC